MGIIHTPPEPLGPDHDLSNFDCGEIVLNDWLIKRALRNHLEGASRTYVIAVDKVVVAYYCLAAGSVDSEIAPGKVKRNMPDPIPVIVLGRLAVDLRHQKAGLGKGLIKDAYLRTLNAAELVSARALLVHALHDNAKSFYERCGFIASPIQPRTLMLPIKDIRTAIA
ncbi:MAG: GNAT family N-acetyltransferase [Thermosynechococcaceae cyanobacterium]